jgi:hypothetical protein
MFLLQDPRTKIQKEYECMFLSVRGPFQGPSALANSYDTEEDHTSYEGGRNQEKQVS